MDFVGENGMADRTGGMRRELDVGHLGRVLARRKLWLITPALLGMVAAGIGVNMVKPRYMAEAKILIENQESFFTRPDRSEAVAQQAAPDDEAISSQVQVVQSRDIARDAIRALNLQGNPEFDPAARGLGPLQRLLVLLGLERDPLRSTAEDRLLTSYYERLNVYPIVKSRVISVQFTAQDPDLAAAAANKVSDLFIDVQSDAKRSAARSAATSLASLVADLKVKVAAADTRAQEFRAANGLLVGTNNTPLTSQALSDLTSQLTQARNGEADAESKAKLIRDMIAQNRVADVTDVANSDLLRRISEQRITLKATIAQQAMTLLPAHPRMRELRAQLADLDVQLRAASDKVARSLETDARVAAGRVDNLKAALAAQTRTASTAGTDQVQLNEFEQQARLLRDQLDFNTQKYQEALAREGAVSTPADARVISRAVAPDMPSFPKKLPTIAIFTLAGLLLSLGFIVSRELLSGRAFDGRGTLPRAFPEPVSTPVLPVTAQAVAAPVAEIAPAAIVPPHAFPAADPAMADTDLVTMLDMVADHGREGGGVRLVAVSGTEAAAAMPDAALLLGRALARRSRAILIDCGAGIGLERLLALPRVAGAQPIRGLCNLLAGDTSFAEVIHRDPLTRLHLVPYGMMEADGSDADFGVLVDALAETYDHVIMAAPLPEAGSAFRGAAQGDLAILFTTGSTLPETVGESRVTLHEAGLPSVYVLDVAELEPGVEPHSAAA